MFSRRGFFERIARMAEDPQKIREQRVSELRAWALECAPLDWDSEQREETARAVEVKLSYLSDETLSQDNMKKYVENGGRIRGFAVPASRPEADLFGCLDCVFVQSVPQATQHPQDLDLA